MAQKLLLTTIGGTSLANNTTNYVPPWDGGGSINTTESIRQSLVRSVGAYSLMTCYIPTNTLSVTLTVNSRVNSAAGNQTIPITTASTGVFQDLTHSDSPTAGQTIGYQYAAPAGSGSASLQNCSMQFAATTNSSMRYGSIAGSYTLTSTTTFPPIGVAQLGDNATTEAFYQTKFKVAGTLKNGHAQVSANGRSSTTTIVSRIGGSNGNLSISITATSTGSFEDTSNSDALSSGSLVNWAVTVGTGIGTLTIPILEVDVLYTGTAAQWISGGDSTFGINQVASAGNSIFIIPQGRNVTGEVTESNVAARQTSADTQTLSNMAVLVPSTTPSTGDNVVVTSRVNSAAGNQTITVAATTTGYFEDTTHSDSVPQSSTYDYRATSGGSLATRGFFSMYASIATGPAAPATNVTNFFFDG